MASGDGGKPGQWSARKAQLVAQKYESAGGGYSGAKTEGQKSLSKWTDQKWTTSDGKPAERKGGTTRYLPEKAWDKLSPGERAATNAKKREGSRKGEQFVKNTEAAAEARKEAFEKESETRWARELREGSPDVVAAIRERMPKKLVDALAAQPRGGAREATPLADDIVIARGRVAAYAGTKPPAWQTRTSPATWRLRGRVTAPSAPFSAPQPADTLMNEARETLSAAPAPVMVSIPEYVPAGSSASTPARAASGHNLLKGLAATAALLGTAYGAKKLHDHFSAEKEDESMDKKATYGFAPEVSKEASEGGAWQRSEGKNPEGGLNAKGRASLKAQGHDIKPGVKGPADTPEKMKRKGSFLSRMFGPGAPGSMKQENGEPSRRALSAKAWGEPVPQDDAGRARLYAKGQALLKRYEGKKEAALVEGIREQAVKTAMAHYGLKIASIDPKLLAAATPSAQLGETPGTLEFKTPGGHTVVSPYTDEVIKHHIKRLGGQKAYYEHLGRTLSDLGVNTDRDIELSRDKRVKQQRAANTFVGANLGGLLGGFGGIAVGHSLKRPGLGALIGTTLGTVGGGLIGRGRNVTRESGPTIQYTEDVPELYKEPEHVGKLRDNLAAVQNQLDNIELDRYLDHLHYNRPYSSYSSYSPYRPYRPYRPYGLYGSF
jgi:hypothetical protein